MIRRRTLSIVPHPNLLNIVYTPTYKNIAHSSSGFKLYFVGESGFEDVDVTLTREHLAATFEQQIVFRHGSPKVVFVHFPVVIPVQFTEQHLHQVLADG